MKLAEVLAESAKPRRPGAFSPAEALASFSANFLDARACRSWVIGRLHPTGARCPICGASISDSRRLDRWRQGLRIQCRDCGRFFTVATGTILAGKHVDYNQVFLLAALVAMGLDNNGIATLVGCNAETVRLWRHRFEALRS